MASSPVFGGDVLRAVMVLVHFLLSLVRFTTKAGASWGWGPKDAVLPLDEQASLHEYRDTLQIADTTCMLSSLKRQERESVESSCGQVACLLLWTFSHPNTV